MDLEEKLIQAKNMLQDPLSFGLSLDVLRIYSNTNILEYYAHEYNTSLDMIAYILNNKNTLDFPYLIDAAGSLNRIWHKKKMEFYAVSYISDLCVNNCVYCGHSKNLRQPRKTLDESEMLLDFKQALKLGPTEICILAGEHKRISPEKLAKAVNIAKIADVHNGLDRVILNVAPMTIEGFSEIRKKTSMNIQYRIFQESYDKETYAKNHLTGPKKDFSFRLHAQERALDAKINDVGIGALLGLNKNSDFEILALITHAYHLFETKGKLPYSISIPRLKAVSDKDINMQYSVSNEDYVKYHAILRIALPGVKIVVTNRETPEMQSILRPMINIHDLDTKPGVGGNYLKNTHMQNDVGDCRSAMDRVLEIKNQGYEVILKGI